MTQEIVRVLRVIEYVGTREWIDTTINGSLHGRKDCGPNCYIQAATLTAYPEVLDVLPTKTVETRDCECCKGECTLTWRELYGWSMHSCACCHGTGKIALP